MTCYGLPYTSISVQLFFVVSQLVEYPEELGRNGVPTCTRQYFVELWDVGTSFISVEALGSITVLFTFMVFFTLPVLIF